jgi:hypothetical protein
MLNVFINKMIRFKVFRLRNYSKSLLIKYNASNTIHK